MSQLDSFRKQLEKLKESTELDINIDKIVSSISEQQKGDKPESKLDRESLIMARIHLDSLIRDYELYHGPRGKKLELIVRIIKENAADQVGEQWVFGDGRITVKKFEQIGTKGKYQKVNAIHETGIIE